jgi:hypothetical protein
MSSCRCTCGWPWDWTNAVGVSPAKEHSQAGAATGITSPISAVITAQHRTDTRQCARPARCPRSLSPTPTMAASSIRVSAASSAQRGHLPHTAASTQSRFSRVFPGAEDVGACNRDAHLGEHPRGCINDLRGRSDSVGGRSERPGGTGVSWVGAKRWISAPRHWIKRRVDSVGAPGHSRSGWPDLCCVRHLAAEAYPHTNICEQCGNFTTTIEFLPQLQAQHVFVAGGDSVI